MSIMSIISREAFSMTIVIYSLFLKGIICSINY